MDIETLKEKVKVISQLQAYKAKKDYVRQLAMDWQNESADETYYWSDISEFENIFTKYGRQYGLLREFHENGIC